MRRDGEDRIRIGADDAVHGQQRVFFRQPAVGFAENLGDVGVGAVADQRKDMGLADGWLIDDQAVLRHLRCGQAADGGQSPQRGKIAFRQPAGLQLP
ncbi:hypothetical protein SDC9_187877 [bioreactor metagenome]|uniref:Uncharacterized protein n=1 Tax=bioreactor metagenome TaxID=1076179 RepID=A0A645HMQ9_9ZZZZ